jgi:uncharacterized protein YjbJ (UPF0337 family)
MSIDKKRVRTQDELNEPAPIDQVEERVEAKMKQVEGAAKKGVAEGLQNDDLAEDGERLKVEGERELSNANKRNR